MSEKKRRKEMFRKKRISNFESNDALLHFKNKDKIVWYSI